MDPTNPSYYGHDQAVVECIDYIESHAFDFLEGNVIKYVTRYESKNGLEDLRKAAWYLQRLIKREENKMRPHDVSLYKSLLEAESNDPEFQCRVGKDMDAFCGPINQS
jgi:hypothetical protein|tara:strand:+ start:54 stop:377 length:324 start_codon:yes stop_codon:yes gene_type:complete